MKAIIFSSFADFAEHQLPGTAGRLDFGLYDPAASPADEDLARLLARACELSDLTQAEVLKRFGAHLFRTFATLYPVFLDGVSSAFELLAGIETYVHGEVQKLYPDAEFPSFTVRAPRTGRLELLYRSRRPLADLAEGMIRGCIDHFGEAIDVRRSDLEAADGHAAQFSLRTVRRPRSLQF